MTSTEINRDSLGMLNNNRRGQPYRVGIVAMTLLGLSFFSAAGQAQPIGKVLVASGSVQAQAAGTTRALTSGALVERGDILITGADGNLQIRFVDEALLMVRPNSRIRIDDYQSEGASLHSIMSLIAGGLRTLTGRIGKSRRDAYLLNTPTASIGVRGTDYELRLCQGDCPAGSSDGLYLGVTEGKIEASNDAGDFPLSAHEYGLIRDKHAALEKLTCPPEALTGVSCADAKTPPAKDPPTGYRAGEDQDRDGLPSAFLRGNLCTTGGRNCSPKSTSSCIPMPACP